MTYDKSELLYEGKAKKIFSVQGDDQVIWQEFKDSFTAFNGEKKATMAGKGVINQKIASLIFFFFSDQGIPSHWVKDQGEDSMVTKKLSMIDLEVVVRNILAGSTAKKFNILEGTALGEPLVEFYYKKDELGDPFISDDQALMLKVVRAPEDLLTLKKLALQVNQVLKKLFHQAQIDLVDFKLEFGYDREGNILLGDEISPDSCRLWDQQTKEKMDKDRFRRDLGQVLEKYQEVLDRLTNQ
ncbi:MAG: phosphoribosylaminoimidazolesuccinocarboxamide synthase [Bdellovibrionales bacterium]|nr:phosphoribosylaminoimidazolesuccinocarboxamide synthase [Bdellovibrionales bacterium]